MKKSELAEIKGLSLEELIKRRISLKGELSSLEMDKNMNKLKDKKSMFKKRKDLAQVMTVLRQKQMLNQLESASQQKAEKDEAADPDSIGADTLKTETVKKRRIKKEAK